MILGYGGKLSGGKTATIIRYALSQGLKGKKIISNIWVNFPPGIKTLYLQNDQFINYLQKYYQDQDKLKEMFFNSVLILDEVVNLLSARKSSTNLNELITNFMMMAGKLDCDIVYSFQVMDSQVDVRLREISQVYGNCYRFTKQGKPLIDAPRIVKDAFGNLIPIRIVVISEFDFDILGKKTKIDIFDPSPYYPLYDTREVTLLDRTKYQRGGSSEIGRRAPKPAWV